MSIKSYAPIHPLALGADIEVPFISCFLLSVQLGTDVTAPPGAVTHTPRSPSVLNIKHMGNINMYSSFNV